MLLNIQVKRPDGTKLFKRNGQSYVYHVVSSEYLPEKKYNRETKKCIGKLLSGADDMMNPNDNFELYYPDMIKSVQVLSEAPKISDTVKAGSFIALKHIAKSEGLLEILRSIYGDANTAKLLDLLCFVITDESAVFSHYEAFIRNHLMSGNNIMSDVQISRFLCTIISDNNINELLREWNKAHTSTQIVYIGYDSTNFNCESDLSICEFGSAKDDKTKPQVNLAVAVSHKDTTPLDYELYPGSIVDMSECEFMLQRMQDYGYSDIGFLFDRGYYTKDNICFLDDKKYNFIMMADENTIFIRSLISDLSETLRHDALLFLIGHEVSGITVLRELYNKDRFFHVYYDDVRASYARRQLNNKIAGLKEALDQRVGKRLRRNASLDAYQNFFELKISEHTEYKNNKEEKYRILDGYCLREKEIRSLMDRYGFFCIVSSREESCYDVLETYRGRDNIEKFFRSIKWGMDVKALGVHSEKALAGKIHVLFLAGILRNRLLRASCAIKQQTRNKRSFTVPGIIDQLEMIECTRSPQKLYRRRYSLTAKQKTIFESLGITEDELDQEISAFNMRVQKIL